MGKCPKNVDNLWLGRSQVILLRLLANWGFQLVLYRCELQIKGSRDIDIHIHVELEVTHIAYCRQKNPSEAPIIIFTVMFNRPTTLTGNPGEHTAIVIHLC